LTSLVLALRINCRLIGSLTPLTRHVAHQPAFSVVTQSQLAWSLRWPICYTANRSV
jgi:hypothetical protein